MKRIDDLQYENLKIIHDTEGFRFGVDSVLLTEFARDIKPNSTIVDLGTGNGILSILLCKKVKPKKIIGIEKQEKVYELCKENIKLNKLENQFEVINADVKDIILKDVDSVVTNPPYKKIGTGINAKNQIQQISRFETTASLDDWIKTSSNILKTKGSFYMVYRTDRLTEVFEILKKYKLEVKKIRFVYSNAKSESNLVLIKAIKGAKPYLKVEKPLIIYKEDGTYTDEVLETYKTK